MATKTHRSADLLVTEQLNRNVQELESAFNAHVLTWHGPIQSPADNLIRQAVEHRMKEGPKNDRLAMVLETPGGYIETAERISNTLRKHYKWVAFVIPDNAMSAGTVLAMSGDEIWMDYYSILGPIDPQISHPGGKGLVPALGYLIKYNELVEKSRDKTLTSAEAAFFVQNFDAAELYYYEQAQKLSIQLLKQWLVKYKFKNWKVTSTRKVPVTIQMRKDRAEEIAKQLGNTELWLSHGRGICMEVLRKRLKLDIQDIESDVKVKTALESYYGLLMNYLATIGASAALHTGKLFMPLDGRRM